MYTVWPSAQEAQHYAAHHGRGYRFAQTADGWAAWLTDDDGGTHCYRCGMAADPDALQELIRGDHHWIADPRGNACAYDGTLSTWDAYPPATPCHRA